MCGMDTRGVGCMCAQETATGSDRDGVVERARERERVGRERKFVGSNHWLLQGRGTALFSQDVNR